MKSDATQRMRHVADKARLARIAADDFGPLVPCRGRRSRMKKSSSSCARSRRPRRTKPPTCAIRRACSRPRRASPSRRCGELAPVALEGRVEQRLAAGGRARRRARARSVRRGRVEVAAARPRRAVVDAVLRHRARDRGAHRSAREFVALTRASSRRASLSPSAPRELGGVAVAASAPRSRPSTNASAWPNSPRG